MAVPYTFGSATSAIPLSQLDSNFNTTITLGNTAIQLGNTVTTLNNMTFANVTISSVSTPITVAQGGTGTSTAFTAGSVVFAGASGVYSQNNANFFWDNTNTRLGIGTTSPAYKLDVAATTAVVQMDSSSGAAGAAGTRYKASNRTWVSGVNLTDGTGAYTVYDVTASAERMRIDSSGNVGIGTNSPSYPLDVRSSVPNATSWVASVNTSATNPSAGFFSYCTGVTGTPYTLWYTDYGGNGVINNTGVSGNGSFLFYNTGSERARITNAGEFWVAGTTDQGAYNIQCNGTGVWGAGAYVNGSDARIKDNIEPLQSGLDTVAKLNPVTFQYKKSWSKDSSTQPGFIAQELQTALADTNYADGVVQQGPKYMSVAYQTLIPVLTKAIQELSAKVEALEAQLAAKG